MHNRTHDRTDLDWARGLVTSALVVAAVWLLTGCNAYQLPTERPAPAAPGYAPTWPKLVVEEASFDASQPSGVVVSQTGRTFVGFSRGKQQQAMSLGELIPDGGLVPYPQGSWNDWNGLGGPGALRGFVSVQAVTTDANDNLWVLDAANPPGWRGVIIGGPKLVKINLDANAITDIIYLDFKRDLHDDSALDELRVDVRTQTAYVTDARDGAILVIDLETNALHKAWLGAHAPGQTPPSESTTEPTGLALSAEGDWLYFHTDGRHVYRVPTQVLRDPAMADAMRSVSVQALGETEVAVDGLWVDAEDNLYLATAQDHAVLVRRGSGAFEPLFAVERPMLFEALTAGPDGSLYVTAMNRPPIKRYHNESVPPPPGFVLKVSPERVAQAELRREIADERHAEAAHYAAQAQEAERLAEQSASVAVNKARRLVRQARVAAQAGAADAEALEEAALASLFQAKRAYQASQAEREAAEALRERVRSAREVAAAAERAAIDAADRSVQPRALEPGLADVPTTTD